MTVVFDFDLLFFGNEASNIAPQIGTALPYITDLNGSLRGANCGTGFTSGVIYGYRNEFGGAILDFGARDLITVRSDTDEFNYGGRLSSWETHGIVFYLVDINDEYYGWILSGGGVIGYTSSLQYTYLQGRTNNNVFSIDRNAPPAFTSGGVLDFTQIKAYEFHSQINNTDLSDRILAYDLRVQSILALVDVGNKVVDIPNAFGDNYKQVFDDPEPKFVANNQSVYAFRQGFNVGDGTIASDLIDANVSIGFNNPQADQNNGFPTTGFVINLVRRDIRCLANATIDLTAFSVSSSSRWAYVNQGGTTILNDGVFQRADFIDVRGNSTLTDVRFDDCGFVQIDSSTTISESRIRNNSDAGDQGLLIDDVAGDYSAIDVTFSNNLGKDITLGSGGAGTYNLSGVSGVSGYTLKVHNNSPTDAVIVQLSNGVTFSTTTAGGAITVNTPPVITNVNLSNLSSAYLYLEDDQGSQVDYQANFTGSYNYPISDGSGTWRLIVDRQGYERKVFTFTADGSAKDFDGNLDLLTNFNGTPKYTGVSSGSVVVDTINHKIELSQGNIDAQIIYNMVQDRSVLADGMADIDINRIDYAVTAFGKQLRLGSYQFLRSLSSTGLPYVKGAVIDQDNDLPVDETNGTIAIDGANVFTVSNALTKEEIRQEIDNNSLVRKLLGNRIVVDEIANELIIYDDDGVTPLATFNSKDNNGNPSSTQIFEFDPI